MRQIKLPRCRYFSYYKVSTAQHLSNILVILGILLLLGSLLLLKYQLFLALLLLLLVLDVPGMSAVVAVPFVANTSAIELVLDFLVASAAVVIPTIADIIAADGVSRIPAVALVSAIACY